MSEKFVLIPCFLAFVKLVFCSSIGLRVSPIAESVNQPSNQQFVVTCRGFGAEPPLFSNIRWYDPRGQEIDSSYSSRINPDIKTEELEVGSLLLHFLNPNPDSSGSYRCSATFQHSDSLETKIQINFFQDIQWEDCPSIQSIVFGAKNERIRCKAKANPKPSIKWLKDSKELDSNRFQIDSNGIQILDSIQSTDGGLFRVRALVVETGRLHETFITVQVLEKPKILELKERFEGIENEETKLFCKTSGRPEPLITWLDPQKRNLSSIGGYFVDRNEGILIISRLKKREDEGLFTCIAQNSAGTQQKTTTVVVWRKPEISSFQNQSFDQNKEAILECRSKGDPKPEMTIRRDGDSRELRSGDPRVNLESFEDKEKEESVLRVILTQIRREDDSLYFCRANNFGGIVERTGHLEVRFPPDMSRTPLTSVKAWDLQTINITCIADAIPNATIRWLFRGEYIQNDLIYSIEDKKNGISILHINTRASSQREIFGFYKCISLNSLGENQIQIHLERASRPSPILQTQHETITPTTITFRVLAPSFDGGMPLNAIHVQYRERDAISQPMKTKKWVLNRKTETYLLDGLNPRTRYSFRFAAENSVGIGDWSQERELWTSRESRPEKPEFRNLPIDVTTKEIVSHFPDQFMVYWTLPPNNGREIRFFEIKYFSVRKTEFGFEAKDRDDYHVTTVSMNDPKESQITSFSAKNLKPNNYYKIEIRANNELGFSEPTSVVFKTSDGIISESNSDLESKKAGFSISLALIIGITICVIIVLLLATDAFFYCRYRVGAIYFFTRNVFSSQNSNQSQRQPKSIENRAFDSRSPQDDPQQPFFGRASAV